MQSRMTKRKVARRYRPRNLKAKGVYYCEKSHQLVIAYKKNPGIPSSFKFMFDAGHCIFGMRVSTNYGDRFTRIGKL